MVVARKRLRLGAASVPSRGLNKSFPNLDVFEVKWFLAVLAVERSLRALSLIMALLLVEADVFLAGGAGDDHELALPLVVQLRRERERGELKVFKGNTHTHTHNCAIVHATS